MVEVLIYSKPGCCLCDEVKAQLIKLRKVYAFDLREINILEDRQAFERFQEEVPVVFINGKKSFKFHLDETEFVKRFEILSSAGRPIQNAT